MGVAFIRAWLWPWGVPIVLALAVLWTLLAGSDGGLGWLFAPLAVAAGVGVALNVPRNV